MKIEQEESFNPIALTLETSADVKAFYSLICFATQGGELDEASVILARKISSWFSQEAKL